MSDTRHNATCRGTSMPSRKLTSLGVTRPRWRRRVFGVMVLALGLVTWGPRLAWGTGAYAAPLCRAEGSPS